MSAAEKLHGLEALAQRAGTAEEGLTARRIASELRRRIGEETLLVRSEAPSDRWCIGRFIAAPGKAEYFAGPVRVAGPLSLSGYGFPRGKIGGPGGSIALFASRTEAERVIAAYGGEVGAIGKDRAMRLGDVHFARTRIYERCWARHHTSSGRTNGALGSAGGGRGSGAVTRTKVAG